MWGRKSNFEKPVHLWFLDIVRKLKKVGSLAYISGTGKHPRSLLAGHESSPWHLAFVMRPVLLLMASAVRLLLKS